MPKRSGYKNDHLDEKRRRVGALQRLEAQLIGLKANDAKYLFLKNDEQPTVDKFKIKMIYVTKQIEVLKGRV